MSRIAMPVQTGEVIDYTNTGTETIAVGDIVVLGKMCGVAEIAIPSSEIGTVSITKVWEVPSVSGASFSPGDALYWDATTKKATQTATNNTPLGVCIAPKAAGGTKTRVKIGVWFGA